MEEKKCLIELSEALRMIKNSKADCPETTIKGRAIWETAHNCSLSCLTNCPPVDAVEVVHGRWLLERTPDGKPYCFHCSVCDDDFSYIGITTAYKYCPHCGAKMDGGSNNE